MKHRKGNLTRRDFLKVTSVMAGSALLSACSGIFAPEFTLTPSPTSTKTSTPTRTPEPTSTSTPEPSPTPTPKPFHVEYRSGGKLFDLVMPFTTVDGREVINFENWRDLPVVDIRDLPNWHEALRKVVKSDGTKLVQPFPADVETPTWSLHGSALGLSFPMCSYDKQPLRIVGGFRYPFPTIDPKYDMWMIGATAQIVHPKNNTIDSLVTGIMSVDDINFCWRALNASGLTAKPQSSIPINENTKPNDPNIQLKHWNYNAYYLSKNGMFKQKEYNTNMILWDTNDFPPKFFNQYPYLGGPSSFYH